MIKTLNEITTELQKRKSYAETLSAAWSNVQRVTKKDGSDFANIKRNFANCRFEPHLGMYGDRLDICIDVRDRLNGYISDGLEIAPRIEPSGKDKELYKALQAAGRIDKYSWYEIYRMTPAEIETAAKERAEYWKKIAGKYTHEIKIAPVAYEHFVNSVNAAVKNLAAETGHNSAPGETSSLFYIITDDMDSFRYNV